MEANLPRIRGEAVVVWRLHTLVLGALALAGCAPGPVMLMPTPEVFRTGEVDVFTTTPEWERTLVIPVAYATNRLPAAEEEYGAQSDDRLRLGLAKIQVGDDPTASWDDLRAISTVSERRAEVPLRLVDVEQYFELPSPFDVAAPPREVLDLLAALERMVAESRDPDLMIFVHGANNTFSRSIAQAAQYRHFTGRHSAVLIFDWPSLAKIWRYRQDVENAAASAPLLAALLELIADHTNIQKVNLLGYSLGALTVSDALDQLRTTNAQQDAAELKQRLRIEEVYYAAADVGVSSFIEQLRGYLDIVGRVSMTVNPADSVLRWSGFIHRGTRAGRVRAAELTAEQRDWVAATTHLPAFDVIRVEEATAAYVLKAHDYWYDNPRVSTDVLMLMLSHAPPDRRGLALVDTAGPFEVWTFSADYPERALEAVRALEAASATR